MLTRTTTIAESIEETRGRSSGFDYMRIALAISVVVIHTTNISYGVHADLRVWSGLPGAISHMVLPMFFALSGFLVAGSLERCPTLVSFYGLRILRIFPALAVEVLISALILGPLLTDRELLSYFSDAQFHRYFFNLIGDIHYRLPGLFAGNPVPFTVNDQLWTVPVELHCYLVLGILAIIGIVRKPFLLVMVLGLGQCLWIWEAATRAYDESTGTNGPVLILCFLAGVLVYLYRKNIVLSTSAFVAAVVLCIALCMLPHGTFLLPIPAAYVTVFLGLCNPPRNKLLQSGDYSYGIYLYGFPIQQLVAWLGPWTHAWYINLFMGLALIIPIACLSWHLVEKHALRLRRYLPPIERAAQAGAVSVIEAGERTRPTAGRPGLQGMTEAGLRFASGFVGLVGIALLLDMHDALGVTAGFASLALGALSFRLVAAPASVTEAPIGAHVATVPSVSEGR